MLVKFEGHDDEEKVVSRASTNIVKLDPAGLKL